jgi:glycosyltransferase involved in cell wall biosynthesis
LTQSARKPPRLSVVVVAYNMQRELPRTLASLAPQYQRGIASDEYEVIVVDNGSCEPVPTAILDGFPSSWRLIRLDPAPPAPAHAANRGIAATTSEYVGLLIDGARLASPGLLARALQARVLADRAIVATLGWHLGRTRHIDAYAVGYDQDAEDRLLAEIEWESDGYRLFDVSTFADSSARGWFGPTGESNGLFMPKAIWNELGGLDEGFTLPGGGLSNHDLFRRACELPDSELIVLLGEGTFHQIHGGIATSGRMRWDEMHAEYVALRGQSYQPPRKKRLYLGTVPDTTLPHLEHSVSWALAHPSDLPD